MNKDSLLSIDEAVKIKCQFCEIAETCNRRARKEKYEQSGMITRCIITPNRLDSKRKKRKKSKKRKKA